MNNLIEDDSNKNLWKFIKSRKQDTTGTAPLIDQGITYSNDEDKANILNRQFCSVFTSENNNIPPTPVPNVKVPIMPDIVITERGVEKLLSELNPQKAAGPDRIPTRLLKMMSLEISPALTKLFQMSLNTGEIPKIWKHAIVQPIFKKGDRAAAQNYRPISLTCVCCKLLEHIIRSAITKHLESNKILNEAQHGFRKKRSCETQLITVIHDITSQLDKGGQTDLVLLDFAKAFDKVPHRRLINKLFSVGINQTALTWIESFLSGRSQEVVVGGKESSSEPVTSGVPQGSVLGPTLFLVYINDLPDNIRSKVCLFADDTILFKHIHSESDCEILQKDLDILKNWGEKWLMEFNVTKCHVMSITNKKTPFKFDYHLHNQKLEKVKSSKYLGVEISSDMKWSNHIAQITSKANRTSAFITRNLKGCPRKTQLHCYKSLVRPILEYASISWDPHHKKDIEALEAIQKRSARRIVNNFSTYTSASRITSDLGLEKLQTRRKREKLATIHKIYNSKIDVNFPETFRQSTRKTRGHGKKMTFPVARTDTHKHSFFPSAVTLWNNLPPDAAETGCLNVFKRIVSYCVRD